VEKLIGEDLGGEELWKAGDLKIPVFNTEDGEFFTCKIHSRAHIDFPL
jgi:hypothetical protein